MENKDFENLLSDLYNLYNPSKKKEVERIINTYDGREYDAVKTILIIYNLKFENVKLKSRSHFKWRSKCSS